MMHESIAIGDKTVTGYVIPLGPVNLVFLKSDIGMLACGAFDVAALDNFNYPAAKVKSSTGGPITTLEDLLNGALREVNKTAAGRGLSVGMPVREAVALL